MFISRRTPHLRQTIYAIGIAFLTFWVVLASFNSKTQLQQIKERGVLKVATLRSPNTYYLEGSQPEGLEYQLANTYADSLNVRLQIRVYPDFEHLFRALDDRTAHVVAAGLPDIPPWNQKYIDSGSYAFDTPVVIYRQTQGFTPAKTIEALADNRIELVANSPSEIKMRTLRKHTAGLRWHAVKTSNELDILTRLQNREIDYAIVSQRLWKNYASYHPELRRAFNLEQPQPLTWFTRNHIDSSLEDSLTDFFNKHETQQLVTRLIQESKPPNNPLNYFDTVSFRNAVETRYAQLKPYFSQAAEETGFDSILLASIAYQESHWKEHAVSPTGVKGIMMLTEGAATEVGVNDRTDPHQSIIGGAKYLQIMMDKIPERIPPPDRLWFALAAYNIGYGHLEDARILTQKGGKNPDLWKDVREFLPHLADEAIYPETRYGFARGEEPVTYVKNVRAYQKILLTEERLSQLRDLKIDPVTDS